ncbi:hypothetical protein IPM09_03335 [Candidatus Saccharibacteria bacterium]|nr:MAG: hypothetical protein IPM09_03335 [Candidatus Saccharibacteria bacterium]
MKTYRRFETGAINGSIFAIVALVLLVIVFGSFSIWAYINYTEQKNDVDGKIADATAAAVLKNSEQMQQKFDEDEKKPYEQFTGPVDYGRLTFTYPKFWAAYQATDVSQGGGATYEAYFNPYVVPPITKTTKYALRITIEQKLYAKVLDGYGALIKKGDLKSSVYDDGTHQGTRLEGAFSKDMVGVAVLIKMRDRTLTMRTDGDVFKADFETILKTVKFNE